MPSVSSTTFSHPPRRQRQRHWYYYGRRRRVAAVWVVALLLLFHVGLQFWMVTKYEADNDFSQKEEKASSFVSSSLSYFKQKRGEKTTTTTTIKTTPIAAACVLVMDDVHSLSEFLAYHYHAVNLRRVILAMDPRSQTSPYSTLLSSWMTTTNRSNTDHNHQHFLNITLWEEDSDYIRSQEDFQSTLGQVQRTFATKTTPLPPTLAEHKTRQRLFYQECLKQLKREEQDENSSRMNTYTLLLDTDEFLTLNYDLLHQQNTTVSVASPAEPNFVWNFLQEYTRSTTTKAAVVSSMKRIKEGGSTTTTKAAAAATAPWQNLQSSPCLQVPRLRFGSQENDDDDEANNWAPHDWKNNASANFMTLRFHHHAAWSNHVVNKISKAILDLSQIPADTLLGGDDDDEKDNNKKIPYTLTSIHLPLRKSSHDDTDKKEYCIQRRLHTPLSQSFLKIHHYLGSWESYQYREQDARWETPQTRSRAQFDAQSKAATMKATTREQQPQYNIGKWLSGFVETAKRNQYPDPHQVLQNVGQLQPKSWTTYLGDSTKERCALLFFGLPRAFQSIVLPSIIQHVLRPNARHNCDVMVHFYQQSQEPAGRKNKGGTIDPTEIYQLQEAVHQVHAQYYHESPRARTFRTPQVSFTYDTNETFWETRGAAIHKYQTTKDDQGNFVYYPYRAGTYQPSNLVNIVKQWHSIEAAYQLLELAQEKMGVQYSRVGMFRSDVFYATPIDIALTEHATQPQDQASRRRRPPPPPKTDTFNQKVVQAGFAQMPVNDRMIYGPKEAVRIWATQRFGALEQRAQDQPEPGYTMHSERFLNASIFPLIRNTQTSYEIVSNPDICFLRVRADESVMIKDCSLGDIRTRNWDKVNVQALVERTIGRNCTRFRMGNGARWTFVGCGQGVEY